MRPCIFGIGKWKELAMELFAPVTLSDEMKAEFIKGNADFCPVCNDGDMDYECKEFDDNGAEQVCHCTNCNRSFKIYYAMTVDDVEII
jgi:hypothetical protein